MLLNHNTTTELKRYVESLYPGLTHKILFISEKSKIETAFKNDKLIKKLYISKIICHNPTNIPQLGTGRGHVFRMKEWCNRSRKLRREAG